MLVSDKHSRFENFQPVYSGDLRPLPFKKGRQIPW